MMACCRVLTSCGVLLFTVLVGVTRATECVSSGMTLNVNFTGIRFTSPGFPANYPRPSSCKWLFTAEQGNRLVFRINTFDVFPSIFCYRDLLELLDGELRYAAVMLAACGTREAGETIRMSTDKALVNFQAVTVGRDAQGFDFDVWSEQYNEPTVGSAHYGLGHMVLMATAGTLAVFLVIGIVVIVCHEKCWTKADD